MRAALLNADLGARGAQAHCGCENKIKLPLDRGRDLVTIRNSRAVRVRQGGVREAVEERVPRHLLRHGLGLPAVQQLPQQVQAVVSSRTGSEAISSGGSCSLIKGCKEAGMDEEVDDAVFA